MNHWAAVYQQDPGGSIWHPKACEVCIQTQAERSTLNFPALTHIAYTCAAQTQRGSTSNGHDCDLLFPSEKMSPDAAASREVVK